MLPVSWYGFSASISGACDMGINGDWQRDSQAQHYWTQVFETRFDDETTPTLIPYSDTGRPKCKRWVQVTPKFLSNNPPTQTLKFIMRLHRAAADTEVNCFFPKKLIRNLWLTKVFFINNGNRPVNVSNFAIIFWGKCWAYVVIGLSVWLSSFIFRHFLLTSRQYNIFKGNHNSCSCNVIFQNKISCSNHTRV